MPEYKTAKPDKPIEVKAIQVYLNKCDLPWLRALIVFLWIYGVRITEALKLSKSDFERKEGFLYVNCPPLKTLENKRRFLPVKLDTSFLEVLLEYLDNVEDLLWPIHRTTVWRKLKKLDIELCPHRYRHNRLTKIALTRAHPMEIMSWAGHSKIGTSMKYIHASGIFAEDLGKKMEIK